MGTTSSSTIDWVRRRRCSPRATPFGVGWDGRSMPPCPQRCYVLAGFRHAQRTALSVAPRCCCLVAAAILFITCQCAIYSYYFCQRADCLVFCCSACGVHCLSSTLSFPLSILMILPRLGWPFPQHALTIYFY